MTNNQQRVLLSLSLLALVGGIAWQLYDPGFEPWLFVVCGFIGLFSLWWPTRGKKYASQRLTGRVTFNYSNKNHRYTIGRNELLFETAWSKASDTSIHVYNDPPSIDSLALAPGIAKINQISNVAHLDFSSRSRTPEEGDIVILKNKYGKYAAIKIIDVKDQSRSDNTDEVTFEYVINPDGGSDFR
jgi:hypothetical protein